MIIKYKEDKGCDCFKNFVENPDDRACMKKFTRHFSQEIMNSSLKLHQRLKAASDVCAYNSLYSNNAIEKLDGVSDKDNFTLKVKITDSYRKFFYYIKDQQTESFLLSSEWHGQFNEINEIFVYDINKHKYKK